MAPARDSIADRLRRSVAAGRAALRVSWRAQPRRRERAGPVARTLAVAGRHVTMHSAADSRRRHGARRGGHRFLVVDRSYAPGHRHGHVAVADGLPPGRRLVHACRSAWPATVRGAKLLFLDLETTGLAGGAGTYAFLVGCAGSTAAVPRPAVLPRRASRPSVRCSRRFATSPPTSARSSPTTASRSTCRSSRRATRCTGWRRRLRAAARGHAASCAAAVARTTDEDERRCRL